MKVICAGMSKTGTKSLNAALTQLGYKVYDYPDNFYYLCDDWMKIFNGNGSKEDFQRMFKDIDAGCDMPINIFWEELLEAFPDAKVVLMMRDNEDEWFASLEQQIKEMSPPTIVAMIQYFSPTGKRLMTYANEISRIMFAAKPYNPVTPPPLNKHISILSYRRNNRSVLQKCPKDKLLVFNCKEGWEPLCKFIGKPVPNTAFPHKNIKGNIVEELRRTHPMYKQLIKEFKLSCVVLFSLFIATVAFSVNKLL